MGESGEPLPKAQRSTPEDERGAESTVRAPSQPAAALFSFPAARPGEPLATQTFEERYALGPELARGAMGRVIVATDRAINREVAIKVMLGRSAEHAMARFERESLMTARLQHPSIIPVYDVGRCATGEPYIVMRLVHGKPLSELIAAAGSLAERLLLLPPVLAAIDALAYAHEQGIIHRDLKPGNILVGRFGETVVIDWGLAKDLRVAEEASEPTAPGPDGTLTLDGAILGTPAYMAPEQARGLPADKRSDVYALGAVLYHLLSGTLPYDTSSVRDTLLKLTTGDPAPLEQRQPGLPTDLLSIVRCAMSRDPDARFPSVRELAEELRRFQSGQLVSAHHYSTRELLARWLRKNRVAVSAAALSLVALGVLGAIGVRRVVAERDRANREAESAKRVAGFLSGMFKTSDPSEARGNSISAREVLDRASKEIDEGLANEPAVQAELMGVMSDVYADLGLAAQAQALERQALATDLRNLGPHDPQTLQAQNGLAILLYQAGRYPDAERMMRELVNERMRANGPDNRETLGAKENLANLLDDTGHPTEALALFEECAARLQRLFGPDDPDTLKAQWNMISIYMEQHQTARAIEIARALLAKQERLSGPDNPDVIQLADGVASLLDEDGQFTEAEKAAGLALERERRVLGAEHPTTLSTRSTLGDVYVGEGRVAEAEKLLREVLALQLRVNGADHPDTLQTESRLEEALAAEKEFPEAIGLARDELERRKRVFGPEHTMALRAMVNLAEMAMRTGDVAEAEPLARKAYQGQLAALGATDPATAEALCTLALIRLAQGDLAQALQLYRQALPSLSRLNLRALLREPLLTARANDPRFAALLAGAKSLADQLERAPRAK